MMEVTSRVNVIVVVVVAVTAPFTRLSIDPILLDGVFSLMTPGGGNSVEELMEMCFTCEYIQCVCTYSSC